MKKIIAALICFCFIFAGAVWAEDDEAATQAAIQMAYKMLDEFDSFKDSAKFRECGFGCGDDNPAKKWLNKCKVLEAKAKKQGVIMPVYTSFTYMQTMGRDYAFGKFEDAASMRRMIESTLEDYEDSEEDE